MKRAGLLLLVILSLAAGYRRFFSVPVPPTLAPKPEASVADVSVKLRVPDAPPASLGVTKDGMPRGPEGTLEDYLRKNSVNGWQVFRDAQGRVTSIVGAKILLAKNTPEEALALAKELAPYFGARAEALQAQAGESVVRSRFSTNYHFEERVEGFEVFDSKLMLSVNQSDSGVSIINNSLKGARSTVSRPAVTQAAAQSALLSYYVNRVPRIDKALAAPVLYSGSTPQQLAWVFYVEMLSPRRERLQVLWGSESNSPVFEVSATSH